VTADATTAVAADPDRDRVVIIDLAGQSSIAYLQLEPGDEPGRVVEGPAGMIHVALRRGGAVVTIDRATYASTRRPVCPAPRGLAYDAIADHLHVACAGGELVTFSSDLSAPPVRKLRLDRDLRDIVVQGDSLLVSRFRSAELLLIGKDGTVTLRNKPPEYFQSASQRAFEPSVAWRTIALPSGGAAMLHQRALISPLDMNSPATPTYYAGFDCNSTVVHGAVTTMRPVGEDGTPTGETPKPGVGGIGVAALPVDIALSPDGSRAAIAAAGSSFILETLMSTVEERDALDDCANSAEQRSLWVTGQPIAVAYDGDSNVLVQVREPPSLLRFGALSGLIIDLFDMPGDDRYDTSHALFHGDPDGITTPSIVCASCHPEGGDDGHVWVFNPLGERRTQAIGGGVLETLPLHWDGDMADLSTIMDKVFVGRMGGMPQGTNRIDAFGQWINTIPHVPTSEPLDAEAVGRGLALFNDPLVGCATCHSGDRLTNSQSVDVGTGGTFQVPSLRGLAVRAPYMHDGCASTLHARFEPGCGGDKHGVTSGLSASQIDDLVAYLETL
jgi:mono/diheme cytochrome c family protein